MALFNLTDIKFKSINDRSFLSGEASGARRLTEYGTSILKYPIDLGSTDKGHYMMIHVHVQDKTSYQANYENSINSESAIQRNRAGLFNQTGALNLGGQVSSAVDSVKRVGEAGGQFLKSIQTLGAGEAINRAADFTAELATKLEKSLPTGVKDVVSGVRGSIGTLNNSTFLRTTKRTTDSIALYMPDTLAFTDNQSYNQLQMGGETASFVGAGASVISSAMAGGKFDAAAAGKNLTPFIAEKLFNAISPITGQNSASALFAGLIGGVQNPQLELLYGSPEFRSFQFQFMFYPRSEKEAIDVQKIIQRLRFHQAPEIMSGTAGYFMVPPSEFDVEFYYDGQINPNIPQISTCVLTNVSADYAPNGFRAYEVPGSIGPSLGKTGMPFAIRLDLTFRELEIMTKFNYQRDESLRNARTPNEVAASAALGDFPG